MVREPDDQLFLRQLTQEISRRGWEMPVLLVLEGSRPLAFLMGQLMWVAQPALSLVWSARHIGQLAQLLEEPSNWDTMIKYLNHDE